MSNLQKENSIREEIEHVQKLFFMELGRAVDAFYKINHVRGLAAAFKVLTKVS